LDEHHNDRFWTVVASFIIVEMMSAFVVRLVLLWALLVQCLSIKPTGPMSTGPNSPMNLFTPSTSSEKDRQQLYEAYNLLHSLAQDFHKPFDSPAVIVVGHQTSGKSALIEALMGFQFNQVRLHNASFVLPSSNPPSFP
jgi:hypothetical protein